jgi:Tfp pilus assembly pilus retraction ATPase PilT
MFVTPAIKNLIKSGDLIQINNNIEMGSQEWMVTMRTFWDRLAQQWAIKTEDYIGYFTNDD